MAAVAEFFKSTVTDNLAKLVQPSGLVPAAALVFLNLAFLYPPALAEQRPIATQFADLSQGWQALTIAAVIFVLGVIFFTIAGAIVDLMAGQAWRASMTGRIGIWLERNRIERLRREPSLRGNLRALGWRVATQYPVTVKPGGEVSDFKALEPTRLGNTLAAGQRHIHRRFGIDIAALGQHLQQTKDIKDAPALSVLRDERTGLDLLANLVLVSLVLWAELVAFNAWRRDWGAVVLAYILLPIGYLVYRLALVKARGWMAALIVLVDLHRGDLRKALGLRDKADAADEHGLWAAASYFYLQGEDAKPGDIFEKPAAPAPPVHVITGPGIETTTVEAAPDHTPHVVQDSWSPVLRQLRYRFLVSAKEDKARLRGPLFVDDPRVDRLPGAVEDADSGCRGTPVFLREGHQGLRFELKAPIGARSLDLHYAVPLALLRDARTATVEADVPGSYRIEGHGGTLKVELRWTPAQLPYVQDGTTKVGAQLEPWGVTFANLKSPNVFLVFADGGSS